MIDSWGKRFTILSCILLTVLAVCWGRLFFLQVLHHDKYQVQAQQQHKVTIPIPAQRGKIYDRNGQILATSITVRSICLNPAEIRYEIPGTATLLAKALNLDRRKLSDDIMTAATADRRFMWVKRLVPAEEEAAVRALDLKGIYYRDEQMRFYPNGKMLAQVIGFTGADQRGLAGAEYTFNSRLSGKDGERDELRDGSAQTISAAGLAFRPAVDGNSVVLTVDCNIQDFLEAAIDRCQQQYAPKSVTGIVLDPHTGEVLAIAERPTFDPNKYGSFPADTYRLRAITDPFEPGSMFKPFVFSGALDERTVRLDQVFFCGSLTVGKRTLHDAHTYGNLSGRDVVVKSSNIGMARVAMLLGIPKTYAYVTAFGFGKKTGIELSSEDPGMVMPLKKWSSYTITSVPMGHEIAVTSMQMASAFTAFANKGVVVEPHLLRGVVGPDGKVIEKLTEPTVRGQIITPQTAQIMLTDVLHKVVKDGTGRLADLDDYEIAGKTGTAQKIINGQYSHNKYVSSFICTGPIDDPRAVVLIVVNEPTRGASFYGGTAAAPYAAEVLKSTLDYMYIDARRRAAPVDYASAELGGGAITVEGDDAP